MIYELLTADYMMHYQAIRIAVSIIGVAIASYFDIFNNKNIPDKILFPFLMIGILIALVDFGLLTIYSFMIAIIIGIIGYFAYRAGQMGAGDVLILMTLCFLLPIYPSEINTTRIQGINTGFQQLPFILSVIIYSGIAFIFYIFIVFTPKIIKYLRAGRIKIHLYQLLYSILMIIVLIMFMYIAARIPIISIWYSILITILVFASIYFTLFKEGLHKIMITNEPINKIEDQEVIAIESMDKAIVNRYKIKKVFRKKDAARLKKAGINKLPVYSGMPLFIPFILIGLILSLVLGDIISLLSS